MLLTVLLSAGYCAIKNMAWRPTGQAASAMKELQERDLYAVLHQFTVICPNVMSEETLGLEGLSAEGDAWKYCAACASSAGWLGTLLDGE
jgi:hypothetical protein